MTGSGMLAAGVKVAELIPRGLGAEPGLLSEIVLVDVVYSDSETDARPRKMIAKFAPLSFKTRLTMDLLRFGEAEYRFYTDLLSKMGGPDNFPGVRPPACFASDFNGVSKNFCIIIEYLENAVFPDQLALSLTAQDAVLCMQAVARFHAPWFGTSCSDVAWVPRADAPVFKLGSIEVKRNWPATHALSRKTAKRVKKGIASGSWPWTFQVPESFERAFPLLSKNMWELTCHMARGMPKLRTLCHGDLRLDNFYFVEQKQANADPAEPEEGSRREKGKTVGLIDWQLINVHLATTDLCYFLAGSFALERLEEMEVLLSNAYLQALGEANPGARKAFSKDEWDEGMQLAIIFQACKVIIGLGGIDLSNERSAKVMDMLAKNTFDMWERHNCAEAIKRFVKGELLSQGGSTQLLPSADL